LALTGEAQYTVFAYYKARLAVHSGLLLKSKEDLQNYIQLVDTEKTQKTVRQIAARQAILRELMYGAKYLLPKDVIKKLEFDESLLLPSFYEIEKEERNGTES
jgi:hypothetical protein